MSGAIDAPGGVKEMSVREGRRMPGFGEHGDFVMMEGEPVRKARDMLPYYGLTLVTLGAEGDPNQFHPPSTFEKQQLVHTAHPGLLEALSGDPAFAGLASWSVEWARCGLPRVELGHRLAASLMSTSMSNQVIEDLVFPWVAFSILIPNGLLAALGVDGCESEMTCAHVLAKGGVVRILATDESAQLWSSPAREQSELGSDDSEGVDSFISLPLDQQDKRALQMVDRLVIGVCALMSSPDDKRMIAKCFGKAGEARRKSPTPRVWTYKLTKPVDFDARALVRDYVRGGGRSPTVQSHVRGHWRRQHYGKQNTLVKWIQVPPHWRGSEWADIALRSHKAASSCE